MASTDIQWTDAVWNPTRGCARVSPGCEHCYAERMAHRFSGKGQPYEGLTVLGKRGPRWNGRARFVPEKLAEPLSWRKPRRVFVNSMSDLFHEDVTNEQIAAVFGVMAATPHITYQLLTKRAERLPTWFEWMDVQTAGARTHACMAALDHEREHHAEGDGGPLHTKHCADPDGPWPLPNVHLGVSVENQDAANERLPHLLDHRVKAAVKWVSAEPLLEPVTLFALDGPIDVPDGETSPLHWVVVGGESGPGARPCDMRWVRSIVEQCEGAGTPVFVKQLGAEPFETVYETATNAFVAGSRYLSDRSGGDPAEWPEDLRVRQWPEPRS